MISGLAGERRFASTIAKRLESLGAITHGDRRATKTQDFSQFNFENKYGASALKSVFNSIKQGTKLSVDPPTQNHESNSAFYRKMKKAFEGIRLFDLNPANTDSIPKFLNRLLGFRVDLQNQLFEYFTDTFNRNIADAKRNNTYDLGTLGKLKLFL